MLVAEAHGKVVAEARDDEDYLTSAVFGHLRYIPPSIFWGNLLGRARGMQECTSLADAVRSRGACVDEYTRLETHFWPRHLSLGEPDLILHFSGEGLPSLFVLIEVKLWSGKSGFGEKDQLARYVRLLDELETLGFKVEKDDVKLLVYLTPRESSVELEESLRAITESESARNRMFRLQWQDIAETARQSAAKPLPNYAEKATVTWAPHILEDVSSFLDRRNLTFFRGFARKDDLVDLVPMAIVFSAPAAACSSFFKGMSEYPDLQLCDVEKGRWTHERTIGGSLFDGFAEDNSLNMFLIEKGVWM